MSREHHKGQSFSPLARVLFILFVVSLGLLAPQQVRVGASYLMYPFVWAQCGIMAWIHSYTAEQKTIQELRIEFNTLKKENEELRARLVAYQALEQYAQETKELIDFKQRYAYTAGRVAHVLLRVISDQEHTILVNAGSVHGVANDMVALYNNVLLGRVVEVYPWHSVVRLVTDRACKVAAFCNATGTVGIHEGGNNLEYTSLTHVSHLDVIHAGDIIMSSGQGLLFPKGFALGTIATYEQGELFYTVTVKPAVDIRTISYCLLVSRSALAC